VLLFPEKAAYIKPELFHLSAAIAAGLHHISRPFREKSLHRLSVGTAAGAFLSFYIFPFLADALNGYQLNVVHIITLSRGVIFLHRAQDSWQKNFSYTYL
jgi:hypothetical protein